MNVKFSFGRLKKDVSEVLLPPNLAGDMQNVDVNIPGEASKRKGFQRALSVDFGGQVTLARKFTDYDGTEVFIVIGPDGIHREV